MTVRRRFRTFAGALTALTVFVAWGDDDDDSTGATNVLLSTNIILESGVNCATGGVSKDFNGTAGKTVVITASGGASLTPQITLYAPDFSTQLAGSSSTGAGRAALTQALTETGTHHVSVCDANGTAGNLSLVVTHQQ